MGSVFKGQYKNLILTVKQFLVWEWKTWSGFYMLMYSLSWLLRLHF